MLATVNGIKLYYDIEGEGIPVIVPSVLGVVPLQRALSKALRDSFQFIFVEPRGTGRSQPSVKMTLDLMVDDLEQLRLNLGLKKMAFLGWSANGFLALEYFKKHPGNVSHLVLVSTPPKFTDDFSRAQQRYWASSASEERKEALRGNLNQLDPEKMRTAPPEQGLIMQYVANGPRYWCDPHYDCSDLWKYNFMNFESVEIFYNVVVKDYDPTSFFQEVTCPVLILHGKYDFVVPHTMWDNERDKLPNHSYHLFEHSGHYPFFEEQQIFDHTVTEGVRQSDSGGPAV